MTEILLDTNLLIYAHDPADLIKQQQAIRLIDHINRAKKGYISVQSLSEFFSAISRPKRGDPPRLSVNKAIKQTKAIANSFLIFDLTPTIAMLAGRGVRDHHLAYYDAQIWATARFNQVPVDFSDDFQDHSTLEAVTLINLFLPEFNIKDWA